MFSKYCAIHLWELSRWEFKLFSSRKTQGQCVQACPLSQYLLASMGGLLFFSDFSDSASCASTWALRLAAAVKVCGQRAHLNVLFTSSPWCAGSFPLKGSCADAGGRRLGGGLEESLWFSLCWRQCAFMFCAKANFLPHSRQRKGFCPVCRYWC